MVSFQKRTEVEFRDTPRRNLNGVFFITTVYSQQTYMSVFALCYTFKEGQLFKKEFL